MPQLLRVKDACQLLGISRSTFYKLVRCRELPVVYLGRAVRVSIDALNELIARRTQRCGDEGAT